MPEVRREVRHGEHVALAVYPRKSSLSAGLVLGQRLDPDRRIDKVIEYTPHCIGHEIKITSAGDLDATVQRWLRQAYDVGAQRDFVRRGNAARRALTLNRSEKPFV